MLYPGSAVKKTLFCVDPNRKYGEEGALGERAERLQKPLAAGLSPLDIVDLVPVFRRVSAPRRPPLRCTGRSAFLLEADFRFASRPANLASIDNEAVDVYTTNKNIRAKHS